MLSFCILGTLVPLLLSYFHGASFFQKIGSPRILLPRTDFDLVLILSIGALAMVGQIFLTKGYVFLPASEASALGYSYVVFAQLLEVSFGKYTPTTLQIFGTILIISSGITIALKRKNENTNLV